VQRDGRVDRLRLVTVQFRAAVFKHAVENGGLRLMSGSTNAALGDGGSLAIRRDGSRFAGAAGGSWRSLIDKRFHYLVAVFETNDIETITGQVKVGPYPRAIAFHPMLNLGAALPHGGMDLTIKLFKTSPLTKCQTVELAKQYSAPTKTHQLILGRRGTTLVHHYRDTLTFIPLALSDDDRAAIESVYRASQRDATPSPPQRRGRHDVGGQAGTRRRGGMPPRANNTRPPTAVRRRWRELSRKSVECRGRQHDSGRQSRFCCQWRAGVARTSLKTPRFSNRPRRSR
jgi:hypothetical protein